mmetsp:Transcript_14099/g.42188  ORF Transcript_14099/g.42188 Transcript_14099/m.42188 type:complete len:217 (-) Transcript_14099:1818-2468(-)
MANMSESLFVAATQAWMGTLKRTASRKNSIEAAWRRGSISRSGLCTLLQTMSRGSGAGMASMRTLPSSLRCVSSAWCAVSRVARLLKVTKPVLLTFEPSVSASSVAKARARLPTVVAATNCAESSTWLEADLPTALAPCTPVIPRPCSHLASESFDEGKCFESLSVGLHLGPASSSSSTPPTGCASWSRLLCRLPGGSDRRGDMGDGDVGDVGDAI